MTDPYEFPINVSTVADKKSRRCCSMVCQRGGLSCSQRFEDRSEWSRVGLSGTVMHVNRLKLAQSTRRSHASYEGLLASLRIGIQW